jgi:hypothetical protein
VDINTPKKIELEVYSCSQGYYIGFPEAKDDPELRISKYYKTDDEAYAVLLSEELI